MIDVHGWSKKPYPQAKLYKNHPVVIPRYWFGEGIGEQVKEVDITVLGTVNASYSVPMANFVPVHEVEYGTIVYRETLLPVVAPLPGVSEQWRCYGAPPDGTQRPPGQEEKNRES